MALGFYGPVAYAGQPDLHPSVIWNSELDYDRALPAIASTLRTALFAQLIDNLIYWPFGAPLTFVPAGIVDYDHSAPSHVVIGGLGYSVDRWELDLMGHYPTRTMLMLVDVDNYVTMNARIGYRVTEHVTVALTAQQFNAPYLAETVGPPCSARSSSA